MAVLDTPPSGRSVEVDPAALVAVQRVALARLSDVRDLVADFLSQPSTPAFRLMTDGAQQFLDVEANQILPEMARAGIDGACAALDDSRRALAGRLNVMAWHQPGSAELSAEAHGFRHDLLHHIELYAALRLPRNGSGP